MLHVFDLFIALDLDIAILEVVLDIQAAELDIFFIIDNYSYFEVVLLSLLAD